MEMVVLWGIHIEYASQECVVTAVESASQEPIHWHMEMAVLGEFIISSYEYASQERAVAAVESASVVLLGISGCAGDEANLY